MSARINNLGSPVSPEQLREIEHRLGLELPPGYRSFLLICNGGEPAPGWFRFGDDDGDFAQVTQFWSAEAMETETQTIRQNYGVPASYISVGAISDEDVLMVSVSPQDRGAVFWNANSDYIEPSEFTRVADSFDALLARLDYVEATKPWMMLIDNNDLAGLRRWLDGGGSAHADSRPLTRQSMHVCRRRFNGCWRRGNLTPRAALNGQRFANKGRIRSQLVPSKCSRTKAC